MKTGSVHQALRVATAERHLALERDAEVEARLRDPHGRAAMVVGLWRFHSRGDQRITPWAPRLAELGFAHRSRAERLTRDLRRLGAAPATEAPSDGPSFAEALGWLYVAEGSALGGRVMRKAMLRDRVDLTGLDFLRDGEDAGAVRWRACLEALERGGADCLPSVVAAACEAFDQARALLSVQPCPEPAT